MKVGRSKLTDLDDAVDMQSCLLAEIQFLPDIGHGHLLWCGDDHGAQSRAPGTCRHEVLHHRNMLI
jgi:hypothetical protein